MAAAIGGAEGADGAGPGGGNADGWGAVIPNCVWYCWTTERKGIVPMMISKGTWRSMAGPEGSTINFLKLKKKSKKKKLLIFNF